MATTQDAFGPLSVVRDATTGTQLAITNKEGTVVAGPDARYTAAQLSALAAAGGLTQYAIYVTSDGGDAYFATSSSTYTSLLAGSIVFSSSAISASAVVKGVSGDPGNFVGILCTSVSGGKATIRDGGSVAGALIPGLGDGGASGLTLTAGQYYSLGAAVYCANGIFLEINGTGTYVCLYQ